MSFRLYLLPDYYTLGFFLDKLTTEMRVREKYSIEYDLNFFDTFDWRLYNNSYVLYCVGDRFTLAELSTNRHVYELLFGGSVDRAEDFPASDFRDEVSRVVGVRALVPYIEVGVLKYVFSVFNEFEVNIADISVFCFKTLSTSLFYLQVESVSGFELQFDFVHNWLMLSGLKERGFQFVFELLCSRFNVSAGRRTAKMVVGFEPKDCSQVVVQQMFRYVWGVAKDNFAFLQRDLDSEFVHDFRVSLRRLRTLISQSKDIFPAEDILPVRDKLVSICKSTNELRDLDVYISNQKYYESLLPEQLAVDGSLDFLFVYLRSRRGEVFESTMSCLFSDEYRRMISEVDYFMSLDRYQGVSLLKGVPIVEFASEKIFLLYKRVEKHGKCCLSIPSREALHSLRVDCKKLRYMIEFFVSLYSRTKVVVLIGFLKKLQDNLGRINDLYVQIEYLLLLVDELALRDRESLIRLGALLGALNSVRLSELTRFGVVFSDFIKIDTKCIVYSLFK